MRKISLTKTKFHLNDEIEEIYESKVKKIGNGAMILSTKKHIGKEVYILVKRRY